MSNVLETLLEQAQKDAVGKIITTANDPAWVDTLMSQATQAITDSELPVELKHASQEAVNKIMANKSKVASLCANSLTLMTQQLAAGNNTKAIDVYISAVIDPEALIALMSSTTNGVLRAKRHLDQLNADAINLLKDITIAGARALLPFLLTLL